MTTSSAPVSLRSSIVGRFARAARSDRVFPWLLVAPALLFLLATVVYPLVFSLVVAFKDFSVGAQFDVFALPSAGLDNFRAVLEDPVFRSAIKTTALMVAIAFTLELALGFALALCVDTLLRDRSDRVYTTLILTPLMLPPIAAALIWRVLLNPQYGWLTEAGGKLGLERQDVLADPTLALWAVALVDVWQWTPFVFLLLLAGLRAIPNELREAARVDGASAWTSFRRLILPLMRWPILLVALIRGTDILRLFDYVYGLTGGGPGYSTETVSYYAFVKGFQNFDLGRGAAASWLIFIVIYGAALLVLRTRPAREAWS